MISGHRHRLAARLAGDPALPWSSPACQLLASEESCRCTSGRACSTSALEPEESAKKAAKAAEAQKKKLRYRAQLSGKLARACAGCMHGHRTQ